MHWIRPHIALSPSPGRFAQVALFGPNDVGRRLVENFIAAVYLARYQARLSCFFPHLLAYYDNQGQLVAAVGLRSGDEGSLFAEQYLEQPVEVVMAQRAIAQIRRQDVVEVGNFAAITPGLARELIMQVTCTLAKARRPWVLFVATQQLRNAFQRLHLSPIELAEANPDRLTDQESDWGDYYASRPRLMCGNVAQGNAFLHRERAEDQWTGWQVPCMAVTP
jgi:hypothetical protein